MIDGDTLEIRGILIRLFGIDAPEDGQICRADGKPYRCGQQAALALADKIDRRPVSCEERDIDRHGRVVAVCFLGDEDLNGWLVREGWALAYRTYSSAYVDEEALAKRDGKGVWRGEFAMPWDWRHRRPRKS